MYDFDELIDSILETKRILKEKTELLHRFPEPQAGEMNSSQSQGRNKVLKEMEELYRMLYALIQINKQMKD